ncbi:MAG: hypothetical protein ILA19_02720 [Bacilli bacterium]|nr:hypothetical protein [Bacilli bacterium]
MDLQELQKQHYNNYVEAVKETVRANTLSLLENDINPLFKTPPLDSMDQIKNKFLMTAKKEKIIIETEQLNKILEDFRKNIVKNLEKIINVRDKAIIDGFDNYISEGKNIKLTKTELNNISKKVKKIIKEELDLCVNNYVLKKADNTFKETNEEYVVKVKKELEKFFNNKGIYQKQLLESIDFKLLVKDTILINGIKEQTERYLFTLNNSRIFNE